MNKIISFGKRYSACRIGNFLPSSFIDKPADVKDADSSLFDAIYSTDPVSGLPTGDIAVFLSEKTNSQVRLFIEQKLMNPRPENPGLSLEQEIINKFGAMSDDDISYFSRNHGESPEEFQDRIRLFMETQKKEIAEKKKNAKLKKVLQDAAAKSGLNLDS